MNSCERIGRKRKSCEVDGENTTSENGAEVIKAPNDNQRTVQETEEGEIKTGTEKSETVFIQDNPEVQTDGVSIEDKTECVPELSNDALNKCSNTDVTPVESECVATEAAKTVSESLTTENTADVNPCSTTEAVVVVTECVTNDAAKCITIEADKVVCENITTKADKVVSESITAKAADVVSECVTAEAAKVECVLTDAIEIVNECSTNKVTEVVSECETENAEKEITESACEEICEKPAEIKFVDVDEIKREEDVADTLYEDAEKEDEHEGKPVITITFAGENTEDYKPAFLNFLEAFPDLKLVDLNNVIQLFKCAASDLTASNNKRAKRKKKKTRKELFSHDENAGEDDEADAGNKRSKWELFVVDASPTDAREHERDRVKFSSKFKALDEEKEEEQKTSGTPMCFNCDGNHTLKDCTEPKDFARIRQAKTNYRNNTPKLTRYHIEDEKYNHLKPGKLSSKLRDALGLGKYELPPHVYKMRVLGYPPGWLEEAKIVRSNITMFDMEGKNVKEKPGGNKSSIDPEKVVNYEGFNVKMDRGMRDQYHQYGVPPFSKNHAKEAMITFINNMATNMEDNLETCDMDIDASSDKEEDTTIKSPRISPTLTDLELKKKQLLVELVDSEFIVLDDTECEVFTPLEKNVVLNDSALNQSVDADPKPDEVEAVASEPNDSRKTPEPTVQHNGTVSDPGPVKHVKQSSFGTPILKSGSPYSRLPKMDNFMKDVTPMINFENLPNSTGKYEQMTGVLERVRKTLKDIHEKT